MTNIDAEVKALIVQKAESFKSFADSFAKNRFLLYSSEFGQNAEEIAALEKIAAGIYCKITPTASGVSLEIDFDDNDSGNYLEVIQHGQTAPLTGGSGGIVTNPDGSTRPSLVPEQLWGNPIEQYAKAGSDVLDEVKMMLKDLFVGRVKELVSESKSEIAKLAKAQVVQTLKQTFRN